VVITEVVGLNLDYKAIFERYDKFRYSREGYILRWIDAIDLKGKSVLEIGLRQGADSEQIIRRGTIWLGLDLTRESTEFLLACD
jgi:2-polyprenyl-3-methyl-5-hydroxy-6-metoxy-1,4-benzoquinol methylase